MDMNANYLTRKGEEVRKSMMLKETELKRHLRECSMGQSKMVALVRERKKSFEELTKYWEDCSAA